MAEQIMGCDATTNMALPRQTGVSLLCLTFTLLLTLTLTLTLHTASAEDNCQLIPVQENIIKEMDVSHNNQQLHVSCTAEVLLHKCEGQCESKATPSVRRHRGFMRDCKCCKEGTLQTRTVVLGRCYRDGELVQNLQVTIEVSDLQSCGCFACTN